MPRVLNMYVYAPFFSGYFESAGRAGRKSRLLGFHERRAVSRGRQAAAPSIRASRPRSASRTCTTCSSPSTPKKKLDCIFFPMVDVLHTPLTNLQGSNACPTVTVTPETVKAAFTKEGDVFAEQGVDVSQSDGELLRSASCSRNRCSSAGAASRALGGGERPRDRQSGFRELDAVRARHSTAGTRGDRPARARKPHRHRHARDGRTITIRG